MKFKTNEVKDFVYDAKYDIFETSEVLDLFTVYSNWRLNPT